MVDLIPDDYRRALRVRRLLRALGWACAGLAVATGLARLGLAYAVRSEQSALAAMREQALATGAQRAKLQDLRARRDDARRQIEALEILRGPAAIGELFLAVDTAMTGKVWFNELSFLREGDLTEARPEPREVGYFILIPRDKPAGAAQGGAATPAAGPAPAAAGPAAIGAIGTAEERVWRTRQRVEIRGQASDHSALAGFMNRFGSQPGIGQVRLVDTSARSYASLQVVEFQLGALLGPHREPAR